MSKLVETFVELARRGVKDYTIANWKRNNVLVTECRTGIVENFANVMEYFTTRQFPRVRDFGKRQSGRRILTTTRCINCGGTVFKLVNNNKYCATCDSLQPTYSLEDDTGINDHNSMTAVGGTKSQTYNYDKPEQFKEFIDGIMGTGRQFYFPNRYVAQVREMITKHPDKLNNNPKQYLIDCLYKLGIAYEYAKKIPNVYYVVTGRPFLEIGDDDMPWIEYVYQQINDVKIRKYPDESIPNGKYMLRRIMTLLNIPFDLKKVGSIKETARLWKMDAKWNKYLEHIDTASILRERAKQL